MDRSTRRRAAPARLLKVALLVAAYGAAVIWASDISAVDAAASARDTIVAAGNLASSHVPEATSTTATTLQGASEEAPLATLAITGVLLFGASAWAAARSRRGRSPLARRARLVVRYLTALI